MLLTEPFVRATRVITPSFVATRYVPVAAMFWLMVARLAFFGVMNMAGLIPRVAG